MGAGGAVGVMGAGGGDALAVSGGAAEGLGGATSVGAAEGLGGAFCVSEAAAVAGADGVLELSAGIGGGPARLCVAARTTISTGKIPSAGR